MRTPRRGGRREEDSDYVSPARKAARAGWQPGDGSPAARSALTKKCHIRLRLFVLVGPIFRSLSATATTKKNLVPG